MTTRAPAPAAGRAASVSGGRAVPQGLAPRPAPVRTAVVPFCGWL